VQLDKTKTIVSLTGSNPLNPETMAFCKKTGIIVYLDLNRDVILTRASKMKLDRIVGMGKMSLSEVLDYRREIYQKYYDVRVLVGDEEDPEDTRTNIIEKLNIDEEYISTRGERTGKQFLDVIREGLAKDGGLFVPKTIPVLKRAQFERLLKMSYSERYYNHNIRCLRILEHFPLGNLDKFELSSMIEKAYSTFSDPKVLPLLKIKDNMFIMEEYYGPTASFKDLALQLFPQLFEKSVQTSYEKYLVLVATSGDTGSAVLDGFKNTNIPVIVLYPYKKVR
jgi:hypothetical protein